MKYSRVVCTGALVVGNWLWSGLGRYFCAWLLRIMGGDYVKDGVRFNGIPIIDLVVFLGFLVYIVFLYCVHVSAFIHCM